METNSQNKIATAVLNSLALEEYESLLKNGNEELNIVIADMQDMVCFVGSVLYNLNTESKTDAIRLIEGLSIHLNRFKKMRIL